MNVKEDESQLSAIARYGLFTLQRCKNFNCNSSDVLLIYILIHIGKVQVALVGVYLVDSLSGLWEK